ncbi:MAG: hypothetical protein NT027_18855 [Proteobacteria bacterium]|nr:hypothetical protein [Pseudomonadota bacterium]
MRYISCKYLYLIWIFVAGLADSVVAKDTSMGKLSRENVILLYSSVLEGKTLVSDTGSTIQFMRGRWITGNRYSIPYKQTFSNRQVIYGTELISEKVGTFYLEQFVNNVLARRYFVSIEGPLDVLRIRPVAVEPSGFISRDCIRRTDSEGTICYVKVKYRDDVIVTEFREKL